MADAPEMGYYTNLQFQRAWALVAGGHVDETARTVETFKPVPSGSQFDHLPTIAMHTVMAHTAGSEAATRSFAATIAQAVRRRPAIAPDALQSGVVTTDPPVTRSLLVTQTRNGRAEALPFANILTLVEDSH